MCARIRLKGRVEISSRSMHWPRNALKSPINIALARNANKLSARDPLPSGYCRTKTNEYHGSSVVEAYSEMEETSASVYPHRLTSLRLNRSILIDISSFPR